jgi:hypothetical protein
LGDPLFKKEAILLFHVFSTYPLSQANETFI